MLIHPIRVNRFKKNSLTEIVRIFKGLGHWVIRIAFILVVVLFEFPSHFIRLQKFSLHWIFEMLELMKMWQMALEYILDIGINDILTLRVEFRPKFIDVFHLFWELLLELLVVLELWRRHHQEDQGILSETQSILPVELWHQNIIDQKLDQSLQFEKVSQQKYFFCDLRIDFHELAFVDSDSIDHGVWVEQDICSIFDVSQETEKQVARELVILVQEAANLAL